jgi:signal transduction histidine kinase
MVRSTRAGVVRELVVATGAAAVLVVVVVGGHVLGVGPPPVLAFVGAALAAAGLPWALPHVDRAVVRLTGHPAVSPWPALAGTTRQMGSGSLDEVLPRLAELAAEGTGSGRAAVWLAVGGRLVEAARSPADPAGVARSGEAVPDLAALLAREDTDHAVPVLDGTTLRAALTISKADAVTPADRQFLRDVADGAGLVLQVVAMNAELAARVDRADGLAAQLQASRQRLTSAREAERRRLVAELSHVTGHRLSGLRAELDTARAVLDGTPGGAAAARAALARARELLDDLLERFRTVARGVHPAVLRDRGPATALEEVVADLPRPVRVTGGADARLAWELESGLYQVAASALRELAGTPGPGEVVARIEHIGGRFRVLIQDGTPPVGPRRLTELLADDVDRLAALGGALRVSADGPTGAVQGDLGPLVLTAELPDRVEPVVEPVLDPVERAGSA